MTARLCTGISLGAACVMEPTAIVTQPHHEEAESQEADWVKALEMFEQMERDRVKMDCAVYTSTIGASCKGSSWAQSMALLEVMGYRKVEPSVASYNEAIRTSETIWMWAEALDFQRTLGRYHIEADTNTYSAAIKVCQTTDQWDRSVSLFALFRKVAQARVRMDTTMFNAAMSCSAQASSWAGAWRMLRSMSRRQVRADRETYTTTMLGVMEGGGWQWALPVLEMMRDGRLALPTRTVAQLKFLGAPESISV